MIENTVLKHAFDRVYYTAELRAQEDYAKSENQALVDRDQLRLKNAKDRIIQFLGLPSGDNNKPREILKRLARWNPNYSTSRNLLQALIIFPANLLLTAGKLSLNIVKLATEFLPYLLAKGSLTLFNAAKEFLMKMMASLKKIAQEDGPPAVAAVIGILGFFVGLGVLVLGAITAASHIVYFVGGATTSPAENLRAAFKAGDELAAGGKSGKVWGVIFALGSILTTACVYAILFPLAIHLLATQAPAVLPTIANGISQFFGIFSAQAGAAVATFLYTTLPTALASFGVMINSAIASPFIGFIVGLAAASAIGVGGVITPAVAVIDQVGETKEDGENARPYYAHRIGIDVKDLRNLVEDDTEYSSYYPAVLTREAIVRTVTKAFGSNEQKDYVELNNF